MEIRRLSPINTEEYRALMLVAYQNHPENFTSSVEERAALPVDWWHSRLSPDINAREIVNGAFQEDKLVGVVGVAFNRRQKTHHKSNLFGMYVKPEYRQHGIGSGLMSFAIETARERPGIAIMQLTVTLHNHAARKLYESYGFMSFGVEPYAVLMGNDFVSKVHMWRFLNPDVLSRA